MRVAYSTIEEIKAILSSENNFDLLGLHQLEGEYKSDTIIGDTTNSGVDEVQ
jgi:hypothetical protein